MSMRAVRYDRFGPPDVLHVETVPRPTRGDGEVLVEVHSASAGGGEPAIRAGKLRRLVRPSFPEGSGVDFAGRVAAAGPGDLSVGDAVWGVMPHRTFGALAEYVSVPPGRVSLAPRSITLSQAAALPAVGTTVLAAFTQHALLRPGDRLLVRGGSGGVGSTAVQLAKHLGAHVTAMVSARDTAWVRELGADVAVDYRAGDLTGHQPFDLVLDTVGTDLRRYRRVLTREGRLVALALDPDHPVRGLAALAAGRVGPGRVRAFSNDPDRAALARLAGLVDAGAVRPVVDGVFPMAQVADVHRRLEAGGVRGKYVIDVREDPTPHAGR